MQIVVSGIAPAFDLRDLDLKLTPGTLDDLVDDGRQIASAALETGRPEVIAALRLDQLDARTQRLARCLNAAAEQIAHTELGADSRGVDAHVAKAERGLARDHAKSSNARQTVGQLARHEIGQ